MPTAVHPLLDEATSDFIQSGVSILASSCDGRGELTVVRAVGCRVSEDRLRVMVLVPLGSPFVAVVRESRRIAVAFTRPSTHQAVQLKGEDSRLRPCEKEDLELSERYSRAFASDVGPLGFTEAFARALTWCDPREIGAVEFTPAAIFLQTPGPRAGERLAG